MQLQGNLGTTAKKTKFPKLTKAFQSLGRIGKALMFPIAVLPIAAIFLRLGAQFASDTEFSSFIKSMFLAAGNTVFDNLFMLFGIGVAFGLTKDNRGEAALVGFVGMTLLSLMMGSGGIGGMDFVDKIYGTINFDMPALDALKSGRFGVPEALLKMIEGPARDEAILNWANENLTGFHRLFGTSYNSILAQNVLNGIISGGLVAFIYNRFNGIELPKALGFFSGRRLIPILVVLAMLIFGLLWAVIFPWIGWSLFQLSSALTSATGNQYANASIAGVYATLNRLLIPFGLHHVPNTFFWFVLGSHDAVGGGQAYGDINIFLKGVAEGNTAGTFQTGFFPTMMFALPALVFAFYKTAESKEQKQKVLSLYAPLALVSFLTGITEPIEFAFMFASPLLYGVYSVLAGVFAFIINLFGIQIGFGFSAGLLDYLLSIPKSLEIIAANKSGVAAVFANPAWLFVIGPMSAATNYFAAVYLIKKKNLNTPGRGTSIISGMLESELNKSSSNGSLSLKSKMIINGLGGWNNISSYQNCATRLRYDVTNLDLVNDNLLKQAGTMGVQKLGNQVQVIIGPTVEILNNEITSHIGEDISINQTNNTVDTSKKVAVEPAKVEKTFKPLFIKAPVDGEVISLDKIGDDSFAMMGQGVAIIPSSGQFVSNTKQKLELGFKTGHAYILNEQGISTLIHIGLDTSKLMELTEKDQKEIFNSKYIDKTSMDLEKGETIVKADLSKMKSNDMRIITPVIVMNETLDGRKLEILVKPNQTVKAGDNLYKVS
ncbi:MAG: PTS transporter subunit EIIC [Mycoplasma sp.]